MGAQNPFGDRRNHAEIDLWVKVPSKKAKAAKSKDEFQKLVQDEAKRQGVDASRAIIGFRYPDHLAPRPDSEAGASPALGALAVGGLVAREVDCENVCHGPHTRRGVVATILGSAGLVALSTLFGKTGRTASAQESYCSCTRKCKKSGLPSTDGCNPNGCYLYYDFHYYNSRDRCGTYCYTRATGGCLNHVCSSYSMPYCRG